MRRNHFEAAKWIDERDIFSCLRQLFRHELNEKLMNEVNSTGKVLLSHTKLNGKFTIRLVISGIRQEEHHAKEVLELLINTLKSLE